MRPDFRRREMVKNTARDCIEYTEICKTLKKKASEKPRHHTKNNRDIKELEQGQKNTHPRPK